MEALAISIDEELKDCIAQLDVSQKKSILELIKSFVKKEEETKPQTIEAYNIELEEAVKRIDAGEYYTHDEVKEMAKNW
ncbi:MAG: hypothetical protein M3R72_07735 [Bacteroidota bacterium]|nr:hypothetical protein [Bacteroidota bacterium]